MEEKTLTFEPPVPQAPPAPAAQYDLKETVAGKPVNRDPVVLQDSFGNKLRAPHPPKPGCKKCYGRGFLGTDMKTNQMLPCRKCYPWKR